MSTNPTSETAPQQGPATRKAIPPRVLLISGILAAAAIGAAGYFITRPPAAPTALTAAPVTVPMTSTPSTQDTSPPPVSTGSIPKAPSTTKTDLTSTTNTDSGRVRDPFAPAEDKGSTSGTVVSTPTARTLPVPTTSSQSLPVQRAPTLPVTRSTPEPRPVVQDSAPVVQRQEPVILPVTPPAVLSPSTPTVTLPASSPQTSVPTTSVTAPTQTITVAPATVAVTPSAVVIPSAPVQPTERLTPTTTTVQPSTPAERPVQTPVTAAPKLNVAQQWLQDNQVTYGGRADSGEITTIVLNTKDGQVFADVGELVPGTEVTLESAANQNLVFTLKGKTAKIVLPVSPTTDTGAQP